MFVIDAEDIAVEKKTKSLLLGESDARKSSTSHIAGKSEVGGEWGERDHFTMDQMAAVPLCREGTEQPNFLLP